MSPDAEAWLRPVADGCVIDVWAVPGASRSGVTGLHGDAVRVRVAAPAERGAANRELLRLLARVLGVRAGDVTLEAGAAGRRKRVHVRGLDAGAAARRLVLHLSVDTPAGHN
jgi:uncharacterized protein (TIGR00251 family)